MKTKKLLLLILVIVFFNCSKDRLLEIENNPFFDNQIPETPNKETIRITDCIYENETFVYYTINETNDLEKDYNQILIKRAHAISDPNTNPVNLEGCRRYLIPEEPVIEYDTSRNQYFEIWETYGEKVNDLTGPNKHEIEL